MSCATDHVQMCVLARQSSEFQNKIFRTVRNMFNKTRLKILVLTLEEVKEIKILPILSCFSLPRHKLGVDKITFVEIESNFKDK